MNRTLATSLTTSIFFVISISGIMLFFHFNDMMVKNLHEILGLAFVTVVVLHLFFNWKSMKNYFNKKAFFASIIVTLAVSVGFISQSLNQGTDPKMAILKGITTAPLAHSLAILNISQEKAMKRLQDANINLKSVKSLKEIAQNNQMNPFKIISLLIMKK